MLEFLPIIIPAVVIIALIAFFISAGYVKAPPDTALIISGLRKKPKILIGKAGFKVPFFERVDRLSLKLIPLDIKTGDAVPTADCINIYVDSAVNVKVSPDSESINIAAQNFLNKTIDDIGKIVGEVLEGNIREIICTMRLRELIGDRKTFVEKVSENVIPDLKRMGIELVSFNVQRFSDANHVIDDLGIDNISQIKKDAAIAKANADKEVEIARARASKEANDAKVQSETEIAIKQNELQIKQAELKKGADIKQAELKRIADAKLAEADAAYKIQEEEQRRTVEITTANANLARQEKELELKEREVYIQEKTLEASIMKEAEAKKYAVQQAAEADQYERQKVAEAELFERMKRAEAEKYEAEQEAEAKKAQAEAERFAKEQEAEAVKAAGLAEAEAVAAKGRAEAEAIQAKAEAEAAGILKKAEAMKEYGDAARQQMELDTLKVYFEQLPKIAEAIGQGYSNVESIKMFGGESSQLAGNIMTSITQVSDGLKESTGFDVQSLLAGFLGGKLASANAGDGAKAESDASENS